jgi:predicted transcriptional regulator
VADRCYLWHNLAEAVERAVSRHRSTCPPDPGAASGVHRMLAEGRNVREIAREPGLPRNTVRRFARAASPEELLSTTAPESGPASSTKAAQPHRELRDGSKRRGLETEQT